MIATLKNIYDNYFNVLSKVGYIRSKETNTLLILAFLKNYLCFRSEGISINEIKDINNMFECLVTNSCLASDLPPEIKAIIGNGSQDSDSIDSRLFIVLPDGKLPTTNIKTNKVYLLPRVDENGDVTNIYTEYIYVNNRWENLGESNSISDNAIDTIFE